MVSGESARTAFAWSIGKGFWWGKTSNPSRTPSLVVVIENTGDTDRPILMGDPPGALIVDGRAYPQGPMILDGNPYLGVNHLYPHAIDLSAWLADGRSHRIQYELGSASSKTVILQLPQN